jgi:hypothetical protein
MTSPFSAARARTTLLLKTRNTSTSSSFRH